MKKMTIKVGRNDLCPCGSGQKFKKCCEGKNTPIPVDIDAYYRKKYDIRLKKPKDIDGIRKAGALVVETHKLVEEMIKPGITTDEINSFVHEYTVKNGAIPAPLNYKGYPKSVCVSVNEVICHGIPGDRVLKEGDIVNIDITSILNGYYEIGRAHV
jgi:methionyl aminopeptidase